MCFAFEGSHTAEHSAAPTRRSLALVPRVLPVLAVLPLTPSVRLERLHVTGFFLYGLLCYKAFVTLGEPSFYPDFRV